MSKAFAWALASVSARTLAVVTIAGIASKAKTIIVKSRSPHTTVWIRWEIRHMAATPKKVRVDHRFAYVLPEKLPSDSAAPLLCAGVTVWSPLRRYARAGSKVGIIGIGGLGHLAIQFARALGCETVAISTSADKKKGGT